MIDIGVRTVREFKEKLAALALETLGQHLWEMKIGGGTACLCKLCQHAREAYRDATGFWPTDAAEIEASRAWGTVRVR